MKTKLHVWLVHPHEPIPIEGERQRGLMRTGLVAQQLVDAGHRVTWFTSRFNHYEKRYRDISASTVQVGPQYEARLLEGIGYRKNLSLARVIHYEKLAQEFLSLAPTLSFPDIIVASYPPPELGAATAKFAHGMRIPFIVDIRDVWPDSFAEYLPAWAKPAVSPLVWWYRKKARYTLKRASAIFAINEGLLTWGRRYASAGFHELDRTFYLGHPWHGGGNRIFPKQFTEQNPLQCVFVCSFGNSYDGPLVIDALRELEMAGERRVKCFLVGDGEQRHVWEQQAKGLQSVVFTGWLDKAQLRTLYQRTHIGIVAIKGGTLSVALPNKFAEYLAFDLPLISTIPNEAARIVQNTGIGLNLEVPEKTAFCRAIQTILQTPDVLPQWSHNAARTFRAFFDADAVYKTYVEQILTVASHTHKLTWLPAEAA